MLISERRPGEASRAAAGMLAPSVERAPGPAHAFGVAARDRYPSYVEFVADRTGIVVPLNRLGILQVALSEKGIKGLRKTALPTTRWLDAKELRELEPALSHGLGAMFNPDDGAVDNVVLVSALEKLCTVNDRITQLTALVIRVDPTGDSCTVRTESSAQYTARHVVIAAGAWAGQISGARLARAVQPARGQLVSYSSSPLRHVAYGPRGYVVPRGAVMIANSGGDGSVLVRVAKSADDRVERLQGDGEEGNDCLAAAAHRWLASMDWDRLCQFRAGLSIAIELH